MDRNKFSAIAHRHHPFANPIGEDKLFKMIDLVSLKSGDKVIDIGAGKCELLIRLVEKFQIIGTGIELFQGAIDEAMQKAKGRIPDSSLEFIVAGARTAVKAQPAGDFNLGICIGSTHTLGGLEVTLSEFKKLVKKNGYILVGEGYWKQPPSPEYLEALGGADESECKTHANTVKAGEDLGLTPLWSYVASDDEWDDYEWLYSMSVENYCFENPDDPDCKAMLEKIRAWRQTYLKWGRDTLGFGLYLYRV